MNRGELKTMIQIYLGSSADDPAFDAAVLDPIVQQARDSLIADINQANANYLSKTVTLVADASDSHLYTFAGQAVPITDFVSWLEVRFTNEDGSALDEARLEELRDRGGDCFCITGPDDAPVLQTSKDSAAGTPLFFRYSYMPRTFTEADDTGSGDGASPEGIPVAYHDLVALEALFCYGLGGEQRLPPELRLRWMDRRAQMLARVGRRGSQNSRSRIMAIE